MYIKRNLEKDIYEALQFFPALLISGARQVGKSTLCLSLDGFNYITLDDTTTFSSAKNDPTGFVKRLKKPVIIDEIQKLPSLLSEIKQDIDTNRTNGQFILTGSANLLSFENISDTLAGRIAVFELYPLSMKELLGKNENVINMLLNLDNVDVSEISNEQVQQHIILGGYPHIQTILKQKMQYIWFSSYIRTYIERDIRDIGELRNLDKFIDMYNILASRSANILNKSNLSKEAHIDYKTLNNYLFLLEQVYQVFELKSYQKNIKKEVIKNSKIYFSDSGVLSHMLKIREIKTLQNSTYKGAIVETFVFSELKKHILNHQEIIDFNYYRTLDKKEIDFIIQVQDKHLAIEVKSSSSVKPDDFKHIKTFRQFHKNTIGIVLYFGENILPFGDGMYAVPMKIFF
jgi:predicted AAA+ superfamily ATPase